MGKNDRKPTTRGRLEPNLFYNPNRQRQALQEEFLTGRRSLLWQEPFVWVPDGAAPKLRKPRKEGVQTVRIKKVMHRRYRSKKRGLGIAPLDRSFANIWADVVAIWPKKWGPPPSEDTVTVVVKKQRSIITE
jgi:hypothetical protein